MDAGDVERSEPGTLGALVRSARGWHGVQLSVLAFIGLCGVLGHGDSSTPRWLQIVAGVLAIAALVIACLSIFVVASVAWPFPPPETSGRRDDPALAARRLRTGVGLTYVAVGAMALAASSSWWPTPSTDEEPAGAAAPTVQVADRSGRTACGVLVDAPTGRVRLSTARGTVELEVTAVADISPVTSC